MPARPLGARLPFGARRSRSSPQTYMAVRAISGNGPPSAPERHDLADGPDKLFEAGSKLAREHLFVAEEQPF